MMVNVTATTLSVTLYGVWIVRKMRIKTATKTTTNVSITQLFFTLLGRCLVCFFLI